MTEREKVIKGLEYCAASCKGAWDENNGCPYMADFIKLGADHNGRCVDLLCEDALALLKAQEPMLVKHTTSTIRCPKCNKQITSRGAIHKEIKYCWKCGQAVKWE